eukprot:5321197-Amphidinium_carterae.1
MMSGASGRSKNAFIAKPIEIIEARLEQKFGAQAAEFDRVVEQDWPHIWCVNSSVQSPSRHKGCAFEKQAMVENISDEDILAKMTDDEVHPKASASSQRRKRQLSGA